MSTVSPRHIRGFLSLAILALVIVRVDAQQTPRPNPFPPGTGSISGTITAGDTGKPIRNALVEITIYENLSSRFKQVTTDAEGKYSLKDLPAGHFQIAAQAPRYIRMTYGQTQPGPVGLNNPARIIELADAQAFTNADFLLQHYSAIEGVVTDEFGDPVPNVTIQASQVLYGGGMRRLMPANPSMEAGPPRPTDDRGRFRISGLSPGDYYVEAISGAFADPNGAGGFAITFFPGTADPAAARLVTLTPGQDARDIAFTLVPSATFPVAGTLVDADGKPFVSGDMMLMPSPKGTALFLIVRALSGEGGRFAFRNVPPGDYTIQAYGRPVGPGGNLAAYAFGYLNVHVGDKDTSNLTVRIPPPRSLRGRIRFEDDPAVPKPQPGNVFIGPRQVEFESAPVAGGPSPQVVHDDWTFEVSAMSGMRVVFAQAQGWFLKSVSIAGQDVTDTPLDLREHDVNDVELLFTTKASTLTASLAPAKDKKVADYNLLVFSTDESRWTLWSRYVAIARPNQQGAFVLRGLPPGQYFAAAIGSTTTGEWQAPEFLRALRAGGDTVLFTLGEGMAAKVDLVAKK